MKKVSIIVPVYNVEKYLKRCLNSLVNQTLTDIEVILVNDGSKDKSQEIINEFKEKYPEKIKAFETVNGGAAKARNYALEHVTGEYIGFVDSDDYVEEDMYEKLYNKAIEENAEIVCCNYYRVQEEVNKFSPKDLEIKESIRTMFLIKVFMKKNCYLMKFHICGTKYLKQILLKITILNLKMT